MTQHVIDYYLDGFTSIQFCKLCSAEGDALQEPCKPIVSGALVFRNLTRAEFDEKYEKCLDQSKPTAK